MVWALGAPWLHHVLKNGLVVRVHMRGCGHVQDGVLEGWAYSCSRLSWKDTKVPRGVPTPA